MNKLCSPLLPFKPVARQTLLFFNTSSECLNKYIIQSKESRIMGKMLSRSSPAKKKWFTSHNPAIMTPPKSLTVRKGQDGKSANRRTSVLNKLFMRNVTDLMTTGEIAAMIHGRQVEISDVNIAPDFSMVNIFWICKGLPSDDETERILEKVAFMLRHDLSQLKTIGVVPKMQFIRDKQYSKVMEVEMLLSKADFGENFVPSDPTFKFKSEFVLNNYALKPHVMEKIKSLEVIEEVEDVPLPPMRNDVMGLDHSKIMSRINIALDKSRSAWKREIQEDNVEPLKRQDDDQTGIDFTSARVQRAHFIEFLRKRQIMKKKANQELSKVAADVNEDIDTDVKQNENDENQLEYDYFTEYLDELSDHSDSLELNEISDKVKT